MWSQQWMEIQMKMLDYLGSNTAILFLGVLPERIDWPGIIQTVHGKME